MGSCGLSLPAGEAGGGGCINKALNKLMLDVASERWAAIRGVGGVVSFLAGLSYWRRIVNLRSYDKWVKD